MRIEMKEGAEIMQIVDKVWKTALEESEYNGGLVYVVLGLAMKGIEDVLRSRGAKDDEVKHLTEIIDEIMEKVKDHHKEANIGYV